MTTVATGAAKNQFWQRIKKETTAQHRAAENAALSAAIMQQEVDLKDYIVYLRCMLDIALFYERQIFPGLQQMIPDIDRRKKSHFLISDLEFFGEDPARGINSFFLPPTTSVARLTGYAYVHEGSTLGGMMIYKHLAGRLGLSPEKGGSYFTCYGNATGAMWKEFLDLMGTCSLYGNNGDEIVEGARIAFDAIGLRLRGGATAP